MRFSELNDLPMSIDLRSLMELKPLFWSIRLSGTNPATPNCVTQLHRAEKLKRTLSLLRSIFAEVAINHATVFFFFFFFLLLLLLFFEKSSLKLDMSTFSLNSCS